MNRHPRSRRAAAGLTCALIAVAGLGACRKGETPQSAARSCDTPQPTGEVALPGGSVLLGARAEHEDEGPAQRVEVAPFSIDRTEVTNAQFAEFVAATGYVTMAERPPDPALYPGVPSEQLKPSAVVFVGTGSPGDFTDPSLWWRVIEGASWKHPEGPASDLKGRERHPAIEVAYQDALAYAHWRGRELPTEAQWEYAARAGREQARFEWGEAPVVENGKARANTWQGIFPVFDQGDDGYRARTAPVGCYPVSGYGLYDMSGNVWEWTRDAYPDTDPANGESGHLIKGGSFLCADNFCLRYRPAARQAGPPDTGSSHIGFRTVSRGGG